MSVITFPTKFKPKPQVEATDLSFEAGFKKHERGLAVLYIYRQTFERLRIIQDLDDLKLQANTESSDFKDTGEFRSRSNHACVWLWSVTPDDVVVFTKTPLVHKLVTKKPREALKPTFFRRVFQVLVDLTYWALRIGCQYEPRNLLHQSRTLPLSPATLTYPAGLYSQQVLASSPDPYRAGCFW